MERLTKRITATTITYIGKAHQYEDGDIPSEVEPAGVRELMVALAAYEDTNLTPEEIVAPFTEDTLLKMTARYLGVEVELLRALAKRPKSAKMPEWKRRLLQSFMRGANE